MPALLAPILAQAITLSVGDRTGISARTFDDEVFVDADTSPSVQLGLTTQRTAWSLGYAPSLTVYSFGEDEEFALLHLGAASASMRWRRHFLTLSQSGGYGRQNLRATPILEPEVVQDPSAPPGPAQDPAGQNQLLDQVISYGFSNSNATLTHLLTRRLTLSEFVGYATSSGLDDVARTVYPLQREVSGGANVGYALTRSDTLYTSAESQYVLTGPVGVLIISAEERWSKRLSATATGEIGAGAAYAQSESETDPEHQVLPVATAALRLEFGRPRQRDALQFTTQLTADVDRTTGGVDERVLWGASAERTRGRLTLGASSTGSQSVNPDSADALTSISAGVSAEYALSAHFSLDANVSGNWQNLSGDNEGVSIFWLGGIGLTYTMRPIRF